MIVYLYAVILTLVNLALWFGILFNLPGAWLMILLAALVEWWTPELMFSWRVLYIAAGIALVGEILEFMLGAAGSSRAGGSKRAAALAILGSIVGAVMGTPLPIPVLGTLMGACAGAFAGSMLGDLWAGRALRPSVKAGRGAAIGRFWGTAAKMTVGGIVAGILTVAAFI